MSHLDDLVGPRATAPPPPPPDDDDMEPAFIDEDAPDTEVVADLDEVDDAPMSESDDETDDAAAAAAEAATRSWTTATPPATRSSPPSDDAIAVVSSHAKPVFAVAWVADGAGRLRDGRRATISPSASSLRRRRRRLRDRLRERGPPRARRHDIRPRVQTTTARCSRPAASTAAR